MGGTAQFRRTARRVGLLAVLLGLPGMHGLAGAHHVAVATTWPVAAVPGPAGAFLADAAPRVMAAAVSHHAGLTVLSVAVLASAAVLAALARRRRASHHLLRTRPRGSPTRTPSAPWRPGQDPVAQLVISRT